MDYLKLSFTDDLGKPVAYWLNPPTSDLKLTPALLRALGKTLLEAADDCQGELAGEKVIYRLTPPKC